jgi:glycine/D-amino acid oxidase-like deaminating enzyme
MSITQGGSMGGHGRNFGPPCRGTLTQMQDKFDVVIVGGAIVGSAVAYFLAQDSGFRGSVLIVERDLSFRDCATARSLASIRHQFSTPENVRISRFGTEFIRSAHERLAVDGDAPDLAFRENGYLFLATAAGQVVLQANHAVQRAEGADVELLGRDQLALRFPWLACADLAAGSLGRSGEGWIDAHALMNGFRRKAQSLGVQVLQAEVDRLDCQGGRVQGVHLADGRRIACGTVVNAAGTGAARLARTAGIDLPVQARKRCVFHFTSPAELPRCPLVIDPTGLYFRPEGDGFLCGIAPPEAEDPESHDFEVPLQAFEDQLWPLLAQRVPGFEAARLKSAWAGHYDVNVLDHNVILGPHPAMANLLFANGFSGHGVQQAPAVGRALAEWVVHGGWRTLDLSALGWQRVIEGRPLRELNVV